MAIPFMKLNRLSRNVFNLDGHRDILNVLIFFIRHYDAQTNPHPLSVVNTDQAYVRNILPCIEKAMDATWLVGGGNNIELGEIGIQVLEQHLQEHLSEWADMRCNLLTYARAFRADARVRIPAHAEVVTGEDWNVNTQHLLDRYEDSVRSCYKGGAENLMESMTITFMGMQSRIQKLEAENAALKAQAVPTATRLVRDNMTLTAAAVSLVTKNLQAEMQSQGFISADTAEEMHTIIDRVIGNASNRPINRG
jgi:hypothetical protein